MIQFRKIKSRLVLLTSSLVMIAIVLIAGMMITIYNNELLRNLKIITDQDLQIVNFTLDEEINKINSIFLNIQEREDLQALVTQINKGEETYELKKEVSDILRAYAYSDVAITSIFLLDLENHVLDPLYQIQPYSTIIESYSELNEYLEYHQGVKLSAPSSFPMKLEDVNNSKSTISYFDQLLSNETFDPLGTLIITVKTDNLFSDFRIDSKEKFDEVYVLDEQDRIIMTLSDEDEHQGLLERVRADGRDSGVIQYERSKYYFNNKKLEAYNHWTVVGVVAYDRMKSVLTVIYKSLMITMAIGFVVVVLFSFVFAGKITNPILELKNAMRQLSVGEWPEPLVPMTNDELKDLIEGFNYMVDEQQVLIEQIYEEQEKKKAYELESIHLKLDLLQSQINPHFIHNTLNAIQYLIKTNKAVEAEQVLKSFNQLLRASMAHEKDFITLNEEIECIKSYVAIQKIRYEDIFDIQLEIDPSCGEVLVPKLMLQPIVENAIFHGIVPKKGRGIIRISVKMVHGTMKICVYDDGVGMSGETINMLLKEDGKGQYSHYNGISFKNINKRLKLVYGNDDGLKISSKSGVGTNISFEIPIKDR